jgi:cell division protein FtsI (penicillin-binding protein 3)
MRTKFVGKKNDLPENIAPPLEIEETPNVSIVRLALAISFPAILLIFLVWSAFRIQILEGKKHLKTVKRLSFTMKKLPTIRGFILDRRHHPLALPTELYSAALDPMKLAYSLMKNIDTGSIKELKDKKQRHAFANSTALHEKILTLADSIGKAISEDPYRLSEKLFAAILKGSRFMYLKRQITDGEVASLKKIKLKRGTMWFPLEPARHYPYRSLAPQILGFTSVDGKGMEGIELKFDIDLKGSVSTIEAQKDAKSGTMLIKGLPDIQVGGANHVVLTIDSLIQRDTEEELMAGLKLYKAKYGAAIVLDAKSGEVLSMVNVPVFDPADRYKLKSDAWRNRAVIDAYELGSVVKPLTMLGALDAGRINVDSDIPLDFVVKFRNEAPWSPKDHISLSKGSIKPWEIISRSSNKGIAKVAELFGTKGLYHLFVNLGFGTTTGIELPAEAAGIFPPLKKWSNKQYLATHSYGHGFSITLMQLVQAYTVFANEGYVIKPHIVRYVVDDRKQMIACYSPAACKGKRWHKRKVIRNKKAVKELLQMMKVVVTGGTGQKADLRRWGYSVAGKTGTAEKSGKKGIGYLQNSNRVTFIGLIPADNPRYIIAVMYDDPEGDPATFDKYNPDKELRKDAGYVAAPVFAKIARRVVYRLGVPPDLKPVSMATAKKGRSRSKNRGGNPYIPPLPTPERVVMPNFVGKTLGATLEMLGELKMECSITGHGRVVEQYPEAGGPLTVCGLTMKPYVDIKRKRVKIEYEKNSSSKAAQKNVNSHSRGNKQ